MSLPEVVWPEVWKIYQREERKSDIKSRAMGESQAWNRAAPGERNEALGEPASLNLTKPPALEPFLFKMFTCVTFYKHTYATFFLKTVVCGEHIKI